MKNTNGVLALLISKKGEIIMQHRDDIPTIANPGKITPFGGEVEENETPKKAIIRELNEEIGLKINGENLELFLFMEFPTRKQQKTVYVLRNVDSENLKCNEGQGIKIINRNDDLETINFSAFSRFLVFRWFGINA